MSRIVRVVRLLLALVAVVASVVGIALYSKTGHERLAWLAIAGLLVLSLTLGWWLWSAERSRRRIATRREAIAHLELLARLGKARLRLARLAHEDAATLSERYAVWDRGVSKVIEEHFGQGELALFDGPARAPLAGDVSEVAASWRESLDRLVDLILRQA